MKTPLFTAVILAAILPATALASVGTERAFEAMREPLSAKVSAPDRVIENPAARNTLAKSDGMVRNSHNIAHETNHVISDGKAPAASSPLD